MKLQAYLFAGCGLFFGIIAAIYAWWSSISPEGLEWTGTVALAVSLFFGLMVGFWLWQASRRHERQAGRAPEDDLDGDIEDNAGEYGFFSPHSWWPLFVAASVAFTGVGFAIGWWMFWIGAVAILLTVIGLVFEYYRKEFQH